jgi:predicted RNase H-like HicB family nuclease
MNDINMFSEYIQAALERAKYDTLEDGSNVATVPGLQGVIAVGDSFEECRKDLIEVIEEWIVARIQWGYSIPPIAGHTIESSKEPIAVVD